MNMFLEVQVSWIGFCLVQRLVIVQWVVIGARGRGCRYRTCGVDIWHSYQHFFTHLIIMRIITLILIKNACLSVGLLDKGYLFLFHSKCMVYWSTGFIESRWSPHRHLELYKQHPWSSQWQRHPKEDPFHGFASWPWPHSPWCHWHQCRA